jgi:hypothetical protein
MDDIDFLQLLPDPLAATHDDEISSDVGGAPASRGTPALVEQFIGIVRSGPKSGNGADYDDARYYVDRSSPKYGRTSIDPLSVKAEVIPGLDQCVTATNLAELADGTHSISPGTAVHVFALDARGRIGSKAYFFDLAPPGLVVVQVVGNSAGAGEYDGQILNGSSDASPSADLAMPAGMTPAGPIDALVINTEETGVAGHRLAAGAYAVGTVRGRTTEATPRSIVVIRGAAGRTDGPTSLPGGGVTPNGTSWSRAGTGTPLTLAVVAAVVWDTSSSALLANVRTLTFDARGLLVGASAESQATVAEATACP